MVSWSNVNGLLTYYWSIMLISSMKIREFWRKNLAGSRLILKPVFKRGGIYSGTFPRRLVPVPISPLVINPLAESFSSYFPMIVFIFCEIRSQSFYIQTFSGHCQTLIFSICTHWMKNVIEYFKVSALMIKMLIKQIFEIIWWNNCIAFNKSHFRIQKIPLYFCFPLIWANMNT